MDVLGTLRVSYMTCVHLTYTHNESSLKIRTKHILNFSLSAESSANDGGVLEALANGAVDVIVVQR